MLVLTRGVNQSIVIGDQIEVMVVDIRGDKVRLGVTAPTVIPVYRNEIYQAIQQQNLEAAKTSTMDLKKLEERFREKRPG